MAKSNANQDHYKIAGRGKPGRDIVQEVHKQKYTQAAENEGGSKYIGGPATINERPEKDVNKDTGQVNESANSSSND